MAYLGTTAASSVANPPILLAKGFGGAPNTTGGSTSGGAGTGLWYYASTNSCTEALAANFFSDAYYLGMKAGDILMQLGCTGSSGCFGMGVIGAVTTNGAALSTGTQITSTFT